MIDISQIRTIREESNITQTQAAELVHTNLKTFQNWEYGRSPMPLSAFELLLLKLNLHPDYELNDKAES